MGKSIWPALLGGMAILVMGVLLSCGSTGEEDDDYNYVPTGDDDDAYDPTDGGGGGGDDDEDDDDEDYFSLTSTAFVGNSLIPAKYTCDNDDPDNGVSPPLAWENPPEGTVAFALTCRDQDSPSGDTHHWGLINIPADTSSLSEGVSPDGSLPGDAWETLNYLDNLGYAGPCPPEDDDAHRYNFTLIALSEEIAAPEGDTELADVLDDLEAVTLGEAVLTGLYAR